MPQGLIEQHSPFYPCVAGIMCDSLQPWSQHSLLWGGKRAARRADTIPAWLTKQAHMQFMI
jgi:hypothetical protein